MSMTPEQVDDMFKRVFEDHNEGRIVLELLIQRFAKNACTVGRPHHLQAGRGP